MSIIDAVSIATVALMLMGSIKRPTPRPIPVRIKRGNQPR